MIKALPQQDSGHGTTLLITLLAQISQSGLGIVGIKLPNRPQIQDTAQAGLLRAQAHSFNIREMESLKILLGKVNTPQLMISNFFKAEIPEGGHSVCKENLTGLLRNLNGAIVVGIALHEGDKTIGRQRFNSMVPQIQVGGLGSIGNCADPLQQKLFVQDFLF